MTDTDLLVSVLATFGLILTAMVLVAVVEAILPLHARGVWHKTHLGPNLALTFITFATSIVFNLALVSILVALDTGSVGLLRLLPLPPLLSAAVAVVVLDLSFYVAHQIGRAHV